MAVDINNEERYAFKHNVLLPLADKTSYNTKNQATSPKTQQLISKMSGPKAKTAYPLNNWTIWVAQTQKIAHAPNKQSHN